MCNHYRNAIRKGAVLPGWTSDVFSETRVPLRFDNLPVDVYPDREGIVVRIEAGAAVVETMRWGFPPVKGPVVTNIRNLASPYWRGWLKPEWRCAVPATSFAEYGQETPKRERWFARTDGAPMWFAGLWRPWEGARGTKANPVTGEHRLFAFLTTEPNSVVAPVHPKAMPVILQAAEIDAWLTAPTPEALKLQRPLPDAELQLLDAETDR